MFPGGRGRRRAPGPSPLPGREKAGGFAEPEVVMMSISERERQTLESIENGLVRSAPKLTSMLAIFTRLTSCPASVSAVPLAARFRQRHHGSNRHDVILYRLLPVQLHIVPTEARQNRAWSGTAGQQVTPGTPGTGSYSPHGRKAAPMPHRAGPA